MNWAQTWTRHILALSVALAPALFAGAAKADYCNYGPTKMATPGGFGPASFCNCGGNNTGYVSGNVSGAGDGRNYNLRYQMVSGSVNYGIEVQALVTFDNGSTDWVPIDSVWGGVSDTAFTSWHVAGGHIESPFYFRTACFLTELN